MYNFSGFNQHVHGCHFCGANIGWYQLHCILDTFMYFFCICRHLYFCFGFSAKQISAKFATSLSHWIDQDWYHGIAYFPNSVYHSCYCIFCLCDVNSFKLNNIFQIVFYCEVRTVWKLQCVPVVDKSTFECALHIVCTVCVLCSGQKRPLAAHPESCLDLHKMLLTRPCTVCTVKFVKLPCLL